ncbi:N-acetylmuramoyl-L-alanine amidase [Candidatus Peregrinibacteria bacterium]|nr:N-acetylmuramoyl-L-alanine amidase [Candidatus Peregrinibacteria bacterium]
MEIINRRLTIHEFRNYVRDYFFGTHPANKLVIHHTWRPTKSQWQGQTSINGLRAYYEGKTWPAGPHIFVAEDGIWLFSPMNKDGIHAGTLNARSIGIEIVGDYDNEIWSGQTKENALGVIQVLMEKLNLNASNIAFHRDVSPKTCPGSAITKEWLFNELSNFRIKPRIPNPITDGIPVPADDEVLIPIWATDAVSFVLKNRLFEIKSKDDVRDAVKFYRFYQIIRDV